MILVLFFFWCAGYHDLRLLEPVIIVSHVRKQLMFGRGERRIFSAVKVAVTNTPLRTVVNCGGVWGMQ